MREYLLLLPILFIFHDMEEIIGFGWFFRNNPDIFDRFPKITKAYKEFTTAGMALAVYDFTYCTFYRAYRTEHLYQEIYTVSNYKLCLSSDKCDYFDKQFGIYCFEFINSFNHSRQYFINDSQS